MDNSIKTTDDLIARLSQDFEPSKPLAHPALRTAVILLLCIVHTVFAAKYIGIRPDVFVNAGDSSFFFEVIAMSSIGILSILAACWLCIPDTRGQNWMVAAPLAILVAFFIWSSGRGIEEGFHFEHLLTWDHCTSKAFLFSFAPSALMIFMLKKGATTRPFVLALMMMLAVTAMGYVGLRFTCANDTIGHSLVSHSVPFVVIGTMIGVFARNIFKW